jgi:hypothetical protein
MPFSTREKLTYQYKRNARLATMKIPCEREIRELLEKLEVSEPFHRIETSKDTACIHAMEKVDTRNRTLES